MKKKFRIIPKYTVVPMLVLVIWHFSVYLGTQLFTKNSHFYILEMGFEDKIPFLPWTVSVYLICYFFWIVNYILAMWQSEEETWCFLTSEIMAKTVCMFFFLFLPTTILRPEPEQNTFWDFCMRCLYTLDAPKNLFPSIHCEASWFCYIGVRSNPKIPKWYKIFSLVFACLVFVSTLTTKQHVFVDTIAGVALAEGCYQLTKRTGLYRAFRSLFEKRKAARE